MTRTLSGRAVALALSILLLTPPIQAQSPEPARRTHEVHWFLDGDRALRLEISRLHAGPNVRSIGAVLYEAPAGSARRFGPGIGPFSIGRPVAESPPLPLPDAFDSNGAVEWRKAIEWTASYDARTVSSRYRVGPDLLEVRFPRDRIDGDRANAPDGPNTPIELVVNGVAAAVDEVATVDGTGGGRHAPRLPSGEPFAPLHDPAGFSASWSGLHSLLEVVSAKGLTTADGPGKGACTGKCLACAGGLLGTLGSSIALIAACGGALVTGGTTGVACLIAFLAHESAMLSTSAACGVCGTCQSNSRRSGIRNAGSRPNCCPCVGLPDCLCPSTCTPGGG